MKTMKKGNEVVRVGEGDVSDQLKSGYSFCPKEEWKKIRDGGKREKKGKGDEKDKGDEMDEGNKGKEKPVAKVEKIGKTEQTGKTGSRPQSKYRAKMADNSN